MLNSYEDLSRFIIIIKRGKIISLNAPRYFDDICPCPYSIQTRKLLVSKEGEVVSIIQNHKG